jgi:putative transposase
MRFKLIDAAKKEFPVQRLCKVLDVSPSGYFAWRSRPASCRQREDLVLLAHIRSSFALSRGTYGSPRMTRELQDEGFRVGRRRTARLMRENGLNARPKRRFKRTTDSHHAFPIAPNLIDQDFSAERPNQKWAADISYVWTTEGWLYLAVVLDLFARRVVGWAVSDRLHKELALKALGKALAVRRPGKGLIHHSDRGSQGGFKRSSQHWLCPSTGATRQAPLQAFSSRASFLALSSGRPPPRRSPRRYAR